MKWSAVGSLFFGRGPAAVIRLVIAVVVDAVNGQFSTRATAHILKKGSERMLPTITDRYSASPVVPPTFVVRIVAALAHGIPDHILRRLCSAMSSASPNLRFSFWIAVFQPPHVVGVAPSTHERRFATLINLAEEAPSSILTRRQRIAVSLPAAVVHRAPSTLFGCLSAVGNGTRLNGAFFQKRTAASMPSLPMEFAPTATVSRPKTAINRAGVIVRIRAHLELILSGAMRTAVSAARPPSILPRIGESR